MGKMPGNTDVYNMSWQVSIGIYNNCITRRIDCQTDNVQSAIMTVKDEFKNIRKSRQNRKITLTVFSRI